jgi:hypothetical protein
MKSWLTPEHLLVAALMALPAFAADNTLTPAETQQGWRLLFDGSTMRNWQDPARKNQPGDAWTIENGCLKTVLKPRIEEDLITEDSFGDFEFAFSWRLSPGANTGVKYRIQDLVFVDKTKVQPGPNGFEGLLGREMETRPSNRAKMARDATGFEYVVGFEMQLIDDARHPDAKRDPRHVTGALYSMIAPQAKAAKAAGEWNDGKIVVRGQRFEHWINGVKILEGTLDADAVRAGVMKRWGPAPGIRDALANPKPRGPISLQHHADEVWFKNLKVRELH